MISFYFLTRKSHLEVSSNIKTLLKICWLKCESVIRKISICYTNLEQKFYVALPKKINRFFRENMFLKGFPVSW